MTRRLLPDRLADERPALRPANAPLLSRPAVRTLARHAIAFLLAGAALALRAALDPLLGDRLPYVTFYIGVAATAFLAGPGPTVVGVELGYVLASWFFVAPRRSFATGPDSDAVSAVAYFAVCAAIFGISELRARAQRRAEASEARLRLENARKDEFIAILSHELRNPLAPLRSGVAILRRAPEGSAAARRALGAMDRQLVHLTRIVDDLLDVNRIARGRIRLRSEHLDLGDVVRGVVEDHRPSFDAAGVAIRAPAPREPIWVQGDGVRLAQVVGNLLDNAAKFTPRGGAATVEVTADPAAGAARVAVRDTGVGLDAELRARLFEPFAQADMPLDRADGGLGLGLAFVKRLVGLHGGRVDAASDGPGTGAEFLVSLPLAAPPVRAPAPAPPVADRCGRRILVIEDNEDAATTLREFLELEGHEVWVAGNGPDGLALERRVHPDTVFCDIGLPGMNGYEVARALRASGEDAMLVALTGYASPDDQRRAREAGFDHHVAKPADLDELSRLARS